MIKPEWKRKDEIKKQFSPIPAIQSSSGLNFMPPPT